MRSTVWSHLRTARTEILWWPTCSLAALALFAACGSESPVTFRFQPVEGAGFRSQWQTTDRQSVEGLRDRVVIQDVEAETKVSRIYSWKWAFETRMTKIEQFRDGQKFDAANPLIGAMMDSPFTVELWEDGSVNTVRGIDEMLRRVRAELPPEPQLRWEAL